SHEPSRSPFNGTRQAAACLGQAPTHVFPVNGPNAGTLKKPRRGTLSHPIGGKTVTSGSVGAWGLVGIPNAANGPVSRTTDPAWGCLGQLTICEEAFR